MVQMRHLIHQVANKNHQAIMMIAVARAKVIRIVIVDARVVVHRKIVHQAVSLRIRRLIQLVNQNQRVRNHLVHHQSQIS